MQVSQERKEGTEPGGGKEGSWRNKKGKPEKEEENRGYINQIMKKEGRGPENLHSQYRRTK